MTSSSLSDLTLTLTVHKATQRVLFAETNRASVNLLFGCLASTLKPATGSDGGHDQTLVPNVFVPKEDSIFYPAIEILGGHDQPSLPNEDVPKFKKLKMFTFEGDYDSVKQPMFFLITDELVVKPWSLRSCMSILKEFNVAGNSDLEEVSLETTEFLKLVKMGFEGENTLTSIYMGKRR